MNRINLLKRKLGLGAFIQNLNQHGLNAQFWNSLIEGEVPRQKNDIFKQKHYHD